MAWPICKFVDRVGAGHTTRLNLNDGDKVRVLDDPGADFTPPPLKRAVSNTLLVEGARVHASAYDNRVIKLPLRLTGCTAQEAAEFLRDLHRELDREQNVLKWQPVPNIKPVYFRTMRSPDYGLDQRREGAGDLRLTIGLLAEPFGYGDRVDSGIITVDNDPNPAGNPNPMRFDITGVPGDVSTPAYIKCKTLGTRKTLIAVRRHGVPGGVYGLQAEAMVEGADTSAAADGTASGGSKEITTFATTPGDAARLTTSFPAGAFDFDPDYRGTYRVFARIAVSDDSGYIYMAAITAGYTIKTGHITIAAGGTTGWRWIDLGLLSVPVGYDPVEIGYSGAYHDPHAILVEFHAADFAANLNWDCFLIVPADEELCIVEGNDGSADRVFDGPHDCAYIYDSGDPSLYGGLMPFVGEIPQLAPNQVNRLAFIRAVDRDNDNIADTTDLEVSYWPRYLYASRVG